MPDVYASTYPEILAKAALRIRTAPTEPSDLLDAIARMLEQEAELAERCGGAYCYPDSLEECGPAAVGAEVNEPGGHHHCRWCSEITEPGSVAVAEAYLNGTH